INLGNPVEITIEDLAKTVIEMTGSRSELINKPLPSDDPRQRQPDITRAKETLGWQPKMDWKEGLKETIEYFDTLIRERSA
ncbi:MAG: SDR family NAD-dependent epimerase/dehydratase, partial [Pseudomonadota bacterium]